MKRTQKELSSSFPVLKVGATCTVWILKVNVLKSEALDQFPTGVLQNRSVLLGKGEGVCV